MQKWKCGLWKQRRWPSQHNVRFVCLPVQCFISICAHAFVLDMRSNVGNLEVGVNLLLAAIVCKRLLCNKRMTTAVHTWCKEVFVNHEILCAFAMCFDACIRCINLADMMMTWYHYRDDNNWTNDSAKTQKISKCESVVIAFHFILGFVCNSFLAFSHPFFWFIFIYLVGRFVFTRYLGVCDNFFAEKFVFAWCSYTCRI